MPLGPARTSPVNADRLGRCSIGMDAVRRRPIIKVFGATFEWGRSILAAGQPKFESISLWQSVYELSVPERRTLNDKCRGAIVIITHRGCTRTTSSATLSVRSRGRSSAFRRSPKPTRCTRSRRSGDRNASLAVWARPCIRREPLAVLQNIRRTIGEYNFAGRYQQSPAPWAVAWSRPNGSCSAPMNRLLTGRMRTITHARKEHRRPTGPPDGLR
jgi:hypothetical protein